MQIVSLDPAKPRCALQLTSLLIDGTQGTASRESCGEGPLSRSCISDRSGPVRVFVPRCTGRRECRVLAAAGRKERNRESALAAETLGALLTRSDLPGSAASQLEHAVQDEE